MFLGNNQTIWVLDEEESSYKYGEFFGGPYSIRTFTTLEEFTSNLVEKSSRPALLILNYTFQGYDTIEWLRESGIIEHFNFPFIIVSKCEDLNSFRYAFENGAMDYILKPIRPNELVAKVEKAIAHEQNQTVSAREVVLDGARVGNLTSKQSQMLSLFMRSPSRSISREDILEKVWGTTTVHPKTVDVHLYNLRRKLNQHGFIIRSEGGGSWTLLSERINSH